jgi:hypothetical protein
LSLCHGVDGGGGGSTLRDDPVELALLHADLNDLDLVVREHRVGRGDGGGDKPR